MTRTHECRVWLADNEPGENGTCVHIAIDMPIDVSVDMVSPFVGILRVLEAGTGKLRYYPLANIEHWDIS